MDVFGSTETNFLPVARAFGEKKVPEKVEEAAAKYLEKGRKRCNT
jgi:hypothetical protein